MIMIGIFADGDRPAAPTTDPDMPDSDVTEQYCIDNIVIAGSPETVVDRLVEFREDVGPFETLIISHHDWIDKPPWRRHMELMATEVMPRFRDAIGMLAAAD